MRRLFALAMLLLWPLGSRGQPGVQGPDGYFDSPADKQMARAVAAGDTGTMEYLVRSGEVDVLRVGRDATSWLVVAIAARRKDSLEKLLELGALGHRRDAISGQALYTALLVGTRGFFTDLYWLKRLHAAGADLNNRGGGGLLLEKALFTGNRRALDFFLDYGANLEGRTALGGTVVLSAAQMNRFDLANEFLDRGASPWVMDSLGATLGHEAEDCARVVTWDFDSTMEQERRRLLDRLHAIGFPQPAPNVDEAYALREANNWPPSGRSRPAGFQSR